MVEDLLWRGGARESLIWRYLYFLGLANMGPKMIYVSLSSYERLTKEFCILSGGVCY